MNAPRFLRLLLAVLPVAVSGPAAGQTATCRLCDSPAANSPAAALPTPVRRPLTIEVTSSLDFGRLALADRSGGEVELSPDGSAARPSGALVDLGGLRLTVTVLLTGEPGRSVRIDWPDRIALRSGEEGEVALTDIRSDSPRVVRLDRAGEARFRLGGRLQVPGNASGDFRGRIPIAAEYE